MSIRAKMSLLIVLVLVISVSVGLGVWAAINAEQTAEERAERYREARTVAAEIEVTTLSDMVSITQAMGYIKGNTPEQALAEIEVYEGYDEVIEELFATLDTTMDGEYFTKDLREQGIALGETWTTVDTIAMRYIGLKMEEAGIELEAEEGEAEETSEEAADSVDAIAADATDDELEVQLEEAKATVERDFDAFAAELDSLVEEAADTAEAADARLNLVITAGLSAVVVLTALVGFGLITLISRELKRAEEFATAVAKGDLSVEFGEHPADEIGSMTRSVETMKDELVRRVANLREMAGVVMVTAETVSAATTGTRGALDRIESADSAVADAKRSADAALKSAKTLHDLSQQMIDI